MTRREAASIACAHPGCERPSDLNPPYCCLPCEIAMKIGVPHHHSALCDQGGSVSAMSEPKAALLASDRAPETASVARRDQTWDLLAEALTEIVYTRDPLPEGSPRFRLVRDDASNYAVLYVFTLNWNTYRPTETRHTRHEFVVPVATYHKAAWTRWVFDRIASIELHETCESFQIRDDLGCGLLCACTTCDHPRTNHDGRDSSCIGEGCESHRFVCKDGHYYRPYAPHHGNGEDPYAFWPGGTAEQKALAPGEGS